MSSVDERIVQMKFDNKKFESGVKTTMDTLDQLNKGLKLDGASKGLENLNKTAKSVSLAGISEGVDAVASKFTALGAVAFTAMQNITNSAINAGKRIVSALTIDPVKAGFSEYETKMNAIQTILTNTASKGTTLEDVNKVLADLNEYADKTIYNFAEMTRNIGTFTAAGVELDTAATAIKGIANLAAGSGSTSQQASTAMYQLSQALAAGSLKLQDWNSVVNAGMGGELFQNALKKTAKSLGIVVDEAVPFRESLKDGWITAEVLTKTLEKFAEDEMLVAAATQVKTFTQLFDTMKESVQSGWSVSWEYIVGDKEQATKTLTAISNGFNELIGPSTDARNAMLKFWNENKGRDMLIEGLTSAFNGLKSIIKPVSEAFRELFPAMTGEKLVAFTKSFRDLMAKFKMGEKTANNLKRTFKGAFAILDMGVQLAKALAKGFTNLLGKIMPVGDGILGFTAYLGDGIVKINEFLKSGNVFSKVFTKISDVLGFVIEGIRGFVSSIGAALKGMADVDTSGIDKFTDKVKARFKPLSALGTGIGKLFSALGKVLQKISPVFLGFATKIGDALGKFAENIMNAIANADFEEIVDLINSVLGGGILLGINKFVHSLGGVFDDAGGFLEGIVDILDGVKGCLQSWQSSLKATALLKIAGAIAILSAALVALSLVDSNNLTAALAAITTLFIELIASMAIFEKIMGGKGFKGTGKATTTMLGLSVAVLILASAMSKLAKLDANELTKGLMGVAGLTAVLVASAKVLSKVSGKLTKGAVGLIVFTLAIKSLVKPVKELGALSLGSLTKGLVAVGVLMAELALFMKTADLDGMGVLKGVGLLALAGALNVMADAVGKFGSMDIGSITKGLAAVAVVMAEIAIFVKATGDSKKVTSTAIGLTILGAAMLIFAKAIGNMGSLSLGTIAKGLGAMAASLLIVIKAIDLMPKNMMGKSIALVVMASALVILSNALSTMGGMTWEETAKGLITLAGALTIIVIAMSYMQNALSGAAAMFVIAAALAIFTPALKTLGSMGLAEIGVALLALAGVFTILGVAAMVLGGYVPTILGLSAAVALLGVGCLAAGAGVMAFAAGLTALSAAGAGAAAALVVIISSVVGLIPLIIQKLGEGIIAFCNVIAGSSTAIGEAIAAVLVAVINATMTAIPPLMECLGVLLTALLDFLISYVPILIDTGMKLIMAVLQGIADNLGGVIEAATNVIVAFIEGISAQLPKLIKAGVMLIVSFINGLAEAIRDTSDEMGEAFANLGTAMIEGLVKGLFAGLKSIGDAVVRVGKEALNGIKNFLGIKSPSREFKKVGGYTVEGFVNGVKNKVGSAASAAGNMAKNALNSVTSKVSGFATSGKQAVTNMVNGMSSKISSAKSTASKVASDAANALKSKASSFASAGKNVINGFIDGLKSRISSVANSAANMAKSALNAAKKVLGINSPSKEFEDVGMYSDEGFSNGLKKFAGVVKNSAVDVGNTAVESIKSPMSKISDILNGDIDTEPTIRPVLDLSQISADSRYLNNMFGQRSVAIAGVNGGVINSDARTLSAVASQMQRINNSGNTDIVKEITNLRGDISALADAFSNMQVTMDGNAVVGQLITRIDNGLGKITTHKGRGN